MMLECLSLGIQVLFMEDNTEDDTADWVLCWAPFFWLSLHTKDYLRHHDKLA